MTKLIKLHSVGDNSTVLVNIDHISVVTTEKDGENKRKSCITFDDNVCGVEGVDVFESPEVIFDMVNK